MKKSGSTTSMAPHTLRAAIYTRKSTEEGLDQPFSTLDAQRESAEAYIASQRNEGWQALPTRFDDGGFSGGNLERPALKRLMAEIEAGNVDVVVVYKIDRLSRSLLDFARILECFERHKVAFVSVTQRFSTADSMGRLMMNVLLSFAQFEREIIGERIRDKLAAQRRKGRWTGGAPVLGYDVDRSGTAPRLALNHAESARARDIFQMYLDLGSLLPVVQELARRDWKNKAWSTKTGIVKGGQPFDRNSLYAMLTNPLYCGHIRYKKEVHPGEHEAIVSPEMFKQVQMQLQHNRRRGAHHLKNKHGALLRGLLFCKACDRAMTHVFTSKGNKRYRYYACGAGIKKGRATCPSPSLPAAEIERVVVEEVRSVTARTDLRAEVIAAAVSHEQAQRQELDTKHADTLRRVARCQSEIGRVASQSRPTSQSTARLGVLHDELMQLDAQRSQIECEQSVRSRAVISESELLRAFDQFDGMWGALSPKEQASALATLVKRVEFDVATSAIEVRFHDVAGTGTSDVKNEEAA